MQGVFEIIAERETAGGWAFDVQEIRGDGSLAGITLTLSWQNRS